MNNIPFLGWRGARINLFYIYLFTCMWIKESYISRIFRDLGFAIYYYCIIERWLLSKEARYTKSFINKWLIFLIKGGTQPLNLLMNLYNFWFNVFAYEMDKIRITCCCDLMYCKCKVINKKYNFLTTAVVVQSVRALAPQAEGWVFVSQPRHLSR